MPVYVIGKEQKGPKERGLLADFVPSVGDGELRKELSELSGEKDTHPAGRKGK